MITKSVFPTLHQYFDVVGMCEVVRFNVRMVGWITRQQADNTSRLWMKQNRSQTETLVVQHVTKQVLEHLQNKTEKFTGPQHRLISLALDPSAYPPLGLI